MLERIQRLSPDSKRAILTALDLALTVAAFVAAMELIAPDAALTPHAPALLAALAVVGAGTIRLGLADMRLVDYAAHGVGRSAGLATVATAGAHAVSLLGGAVLEVKAAVVMGLLMLAFWVLGRVALLSVVSEIWRRGQSMTPVLIYGSGTTGQQLAQALVRENGVLPMAFVDDAPALHGRRVAGLRVHPPTALDALRGRFGAERVVIAMPSLNQPRRMALARDLEKRGFEVEMVPSFAQLVGAESIADSLEPASPERFMGRPELGDVMETSGETYAGRSVMVTGGGGSIGLELCRQVLARRPSRLVLLELSELNLFQAVRVLETQARDAGCTLVPVLGTATDARAAARIIRENDVRIILHAAAFKHVDIVEANAVAGMFNNVLGTAVMARAAHHAGCERFVLVSTDKAVRPRGLMGASKRMAEMVVQDMARRSEAEAEADPARTATVFSMVRFGNVLGSSGSVMPRFREQIGGGGPVTVTHPDMERFFMSIDEAARLVLMAGRIARGGEVFVLDMGEPRRILDLAFEMIRSQGYEPRLPGSRDGDVPIEFTGLRPGEKLREELLIGPGDRATRHPKIFRARERVPSAEQIAEMTRTLRAAARTGDPAAMRAIASRWVEGYAPEPDPAVAHASTQAAARDRMADDETERHVSTHARA